MKPQENRRLFSLSAEEMSIFISQEPSFVFECLPWVVVSQRPDWVARYQPSWMIENCTGYMLANHLQYVSMAKPDIVFKHDPNALVLLNPKYLIDYHLDWVLANTPDLLGEVSAGWLSRAHYRSKNKKHGLFAGFFYRFFSTFTFPWRKHGKPLNPYLTDTMISNLNSTTDLYKCQVQPEQTEG